MAGSEHRSSESSRKSSVSSRPKSSSARVGNLRTRPLPRDTKRSQTPPRTDESGLTSFPSLSPSLANSPVASPKSAHRFHSLSLPNDAAPSLTPTQHGNLDGLFAGSTPSEGRSALFEDSPKNVRQIPGTLHLQSDRNLEHMIKRVGATTLVKRMAEDLAQRDAQITHLQRRAEERERLLRKMLRECEVSNLKIENRLKELESNQNEQDQTRKQSAKSQASTSGYQSDVSIDEQLSEAFVDILGGNDTRNGKSGLQQISSLHGTNSKSGSRKTSAEFSRSTSFKEATTRKSTTSRGWKSYFTSQGNQKNSSDTVRAPMKRTASAQERLSAIHTASQANLRRQRLNSDLFKSPPADSDSEDRISSIVGRDRKATENVMSDSRSTKSTSSLTSWASKLVGGRSQSQNQDTAPPSQSESGAADTKSTTTNSTRSKPSATQTKGSQAAAMLSAQAKKSIPSNSAPKPSNESKTDSQHNFAPSTSPDEPAARPHPPPGPMEMDTILPDHTRPPTLLPYENAGDSSEFLTDRYGFIYDQRRRARQNVPLSTKDRNKRGSRVETLENHRRSWNSLGVPDADNISVRSHKSNENVDPAHFSPTVDNALDTQAPKKWQDYLKLSSLSSELLSHTPSVAPTTNVITADDQLDQKPQITISDRVSIVSPTSNPAPAPSRVISGDAEFAQISEPNDDSDALLTDQTVDPVKTLLNQLTDIHDASQREKETRWHEFLRKIRTERYRQGETNDRRPKNAAAVPEASWMDGEIIGVTSVGIEGKAGRAKWLEFKNLVLGGVPLSLRPKVWSECSGALALRIPAYYEELVETHSRDETIVQQIAMDIPRTLTDNIYFRKGDGMGKLSQVLLAYAQRNPEVGYCQGMNLIAANLLLIMPTAEDAFWMLATLIEKILPDKYYDHSLLTSRADQAVLRQYVGTVLPKLSGHLDDLSIDLEALTFQWFLSVFTDCLSAEALFRVWDVVLCTPPDAGGGSTFLFQIALALLKLNEKELLECTTSAEVYAYINGKMTDHAISIDGLIKAGEALRRVVKKEEVEKKREAVVEADLEVIRERDAVRKDKARARENEESTKSGGDGANDDGKENQNSRSEGESSEATPRRPSESSTDEDDHQRDLVPVSPMPIEEEVQWRA